MWNDVNRHRCHTLSLQIAIPTFFEYPLWFTKPHWPPAWALVRESLGRHEIVGGLHTNADVDLISSIGQLDLLPKLLSCVDVSMSILLILTIICIYHSIK